ncbi:hypothetical protein [Labilibacter marinus]|uniref:hypothetical protein n=1 Tax=Labilibacter marinus TaxID=1477105 RepID=UPI0008340970|nr:hypothetical protein [Labilibacter marinus]
MTKNSFSHIKSFEDFKEEKVRLQYEIRLTEKKLEIKKMEFKSYINPIRFFSSIFKEMGKPIMEFVKAYISGYSEKKKTKKSKKKQKKSPETSTDQTIENSED